MRRMLLVFALLLFTALPAHAQASRDAHVTQVDSSHYPDVTVYVRVADTAGQLLGGLSGADFTITEDGQPVEITGFAGGGANPVTTMLVIDRSGSMEQSGKMRGAQDAARAFVEQMRTGDRTGLIAFNSSVRSVQDFTGSQNDLVDAIERIEPDGGTALYDSVVAGVDALRGVNGRRALLVLTDGQDCRESNSCPRQYGSDHSLNDAIDYANAAGQPLYVVGLGERGSDGQEGIDEHVLEQLATESHGEYFYAPDASKLADLYRSLAAGIQQEYALTYRSPRPFYDGTRRDIEVSVSGAPATAGRYVEQHLIQVRSTPLVAVMLLLPLLGALFVPGLIRRRNGLAPAAPATAATNATLAQPGSVVVIAPDAARCTSCDAALPYADAKFCSQCGTVQTLAQPAEPRRIFCDQCGRPMRVGAHFCSHCGSTAPVLNAVEVIER